MVRWSACTCARHGSCRRRCCYIPFVWAYLAFAMQITDRSMRCVQQSSDDDQWNWKHLRGSVRLCVAANSHCDPISSSQSRSCVHTVHRLQAPPQRRDHTDSFCKWCHISTVIIIDITPHIFRKTWEQRYEMCPFLPCELCYPVGFIVWGALQQ